MKLSFFLKNSFFVFIIALNLLFFSLFISILLSFFLVPSQFLNQHQEVIEFLIAPKSDYLELNLSENEHVHMKDVQIIFRNIKIAWIFIGALFLYLFFTKKIPFRKHLSSFLNYIGAFIIFLIFLALSFFQKSFFLFHRLLFSNDLWLLPPDSLLLVLYPSSFFVSVFVVLGLLFVASLFIFARIR
jgi:uncharacterized membrane protein